MATKTPLRTRFAPSPTGPFHMGSLRTALFNYLLAKQSGGSFILRIEDTDKERSEKKYEDEILETLTWLAIEPDENPVRGGDYGPYRQSERTERYQKYIKQLLDKKRAYYCFCTEEELEAQKQDQASRGETPRYTGKCRSLSSEEVEKNNKAGKPSVIRFITESKQLTFQDLVRGKITFDTGLLGDTVIAKDLQTPLYNFTVVVDDHEMAITHVVRGEDHIPNTPKQILLQEALGFERPVYAHLPLLLGEDRTKLSKRHGHNSVQELQEEGYLPEAIISFLALLGWNPGTDKEIFSLEELTKEFSLDRVQKGGAIFNINRLNWVNSHFIKSKTNGELTQLCLPYLVNAGFITAEWKEQGKMENLPWLFGKEPVSECTIVQTQEKIRFSALESIIALYRERLQKLSEIAGLVDFFFIKELDYQKELLQWKNATDTDIKSILGEVEQLLSQIGEGEWSKETLENTLMHQAEKIGDKGYMLWPFRVALSGKKASAGPFEIAEILGSKKTLQRIKEAQQKL